MQRACSSVNLRTYANVGPLFIDEVGYLSFDDKAADLLYEVVNRRYERKPLNRDYQSGCVATTAIQTRLSQCAEGQSCQHSAQPSPEKLVHECQLWLPYGTTQNAELVPECQIFQLESGSGFEERREGDNQRSEHSVQRGKKVMESAQFPFSQIVRNLREPQVRARVPR